MRRRISVLALALLNAIGAAAADAVVLPVEATLSVEFSTLAPQSFTSTGFVTVNGSGGGLHVESLSLGAGLVGGSLLVPVTDPGAFPITAEQIVVANGAGGVGDTSGGTLVGSIPLPGFVKICLFGTSNNCTDPTSNVSIPLTPIGAGGTAQFGGVISGTVFGAPWTTGTASIVSMTRMGFARGPASATSSTAQTGGSLRLVTPIRISTNIGAGPGTPIPGFATLTLRFVPEPATLALLAAGIGALALAGGRRLG